MSNKFHPKKEYRKAKELELRGRPKLASQIYATLAGYLRSAHKHEQAKACMDRAISLSPNSPRLYIELALCCMATGNEPQAKSAAKSAIEKSVQKAVEHHKTPKCRELVTLQLAAYPMLRIWFYEALLSYDRTQIAYFLDLAQAYTDINNSKDAIKSILSALQIAPYNDTACQQLQKLLEHSSNPLAMTYFESYHKRQISLEDLSVLLSRRRAAKHAESLKEDPPVTAEKDLSTLIRDLETEMGIGNKHDEQSITPLVQEFRRKAEPLLVQDSKARLDLAIAFLEMGLFLEARETVSKIENTDTYYPQAQSLLADIQLGEGHELDALETLQGILRLSRPELNAPNAQGEPQAALHIELFTKYRLTQIYFKLGDMKRASALSHEILEKSANYRNIRDLSRQINDCMKDK